MMWTIGGRRHKVTTEVLWEIGAVVYVVDKVGTFTVIRDIYSSGSDTLHILYGRYDGTRVHWGNNPMPEAPVLFGITLVGGAGFDPAKFTDPNWSRSWGWPCHRESGGSAPAATCHRAEEYCRAITLDYLARDDYAAIERARAVYSAPTRLHQLGRDIDDVRGEIATRQAKLAALLAEADSVAAFTEPQDVAV